MVDRIPASNAWRSYLGVVKTITSAGGSPANARTAAAYQAERVAHHGCPSPGTGFSVGGRTLTVRVSVELPEDAYSALRKTPEGFVKEIPGDHGDHPRRQPGHVLYAATLQAHVAARLAQCPAAERTGGRPHCLAMAAPTRLRRPAGLSNRMHQVTALLCSA